MRGPVGRLRNHIVGAITRRVIFRKAERTFHRLRPDLALPRASGGPLDAMLSPMLHLHGCTPAFEYPRRALPGHIHWIGALKPDAPRAWTRPSWWAELGADDRPVIHLTRGGLRPDMNELVVPTLRALAEEHVLVVVTTGGPSTADVEAVYGAPLPSNCIVTPWIPYDELLGKADLFVTNGGYSGVTRALSHDAGNEAAVLLERLAVGSAKPVSAHRDVERVATRPLDRNHGGHANPQFTTVPALAFRSWLHLRN